MTKLSIFTGYNTGYKTGERGIGNFREINILSNHHKEKVVFLGLSVLFIPSL